MLSSLLPGLRELRAPLAAGYLWLTVGWLVLHSQIPSAAEATGVVADVYAVGRQVGVPVVLTAVSFCAYLIGVLSDAVSRWLLGAAAGRTAAVQVPTSDGPTLSEFSVRRYEAPMALSQRGARSLRELVVDHLAQRLSRPDQQTLDGVATRVGPDRDDALARELGNALERATDPTQPEAERRVVIAQFVDVDSYVPALAADLPLLPSRLLGKDPEVYSAFDRLRTEAEFRAGVTLPLMPLIAVLAAGWSWWWLLLLPLPVLLFGEGVQRVRSAGDLLAETLRARRLESRAVDEVLTGAIRLISDLDPRSSEQAVRTRRRLLGGDHRDTLAAMSTMAGTLQKLGQDDRAEQVQTEIVESNERVHGHDHPETIASRQELAATVGRAGDFRRAETLQREILSTRRAQDGPDHPDTVAAKAQLAVTLREAGFLAEAQSLQGEVLDVRLASPGPGHPSTLAAMDELGLTLREGGWIAQAAEIQRTAYEARVQVLGADHPDTLAAADTLAFTTREAETADVLDQF